MKNLPALMQQELSSGVTQYCYCWRISRQDGVVLGFTDHDQNLEFGGTLFLASTALSGSALEENLGLGVDNLDIETALDADILVEEELEAGFYDAAKVEIFLVNWENLENRLLVKTGSLGELRYGDGYFSAEFRGLGHVIQQPAGRLYQSGCDAVLGDSRCRVNLSASLFHTTGVLEVSEGVRIQLNLAGSFEAQWFSHGIIEWTSGNLAGQVSSIKYHGIETSNSGSAHIFDLWEPLSSSAFMGDACIVKAGCDKLFSTCQQKFSNQINFQGFPHIPGNDFLFSYPRKQ